MKTMTLAIAKIIKHQILILADTHIYNPLLNNRVNVTAAMLKTLLLSPSTAVTFTGSPDLAQRAAHAFIATNKQTAPFRDTIEYFKSATVDTDNEYLLGFAGRRRLFHLLKGRERERTVCWIGDKDGFERFQQGPTASPTLFNRMILFDLELSNATAILSNQVVRFQGVLEDSNVPNVGGFFTLVISQNGVFHQL
jgi:hypothetical protein